MESACSAIRRGRTLRPFVEMAAAAQTAVLLVPARTNVAWFHRALELGAQPRFFKGRPKFELDHDGPGHNSPVDCMFLVFIKPANEPLWMPEDSYVDCSPTRTLSP